MVGDGDNTTVLQAIDTGHPGTVSGTTFQKSQYVVTSYEDDPIRTLQALPKRRQP